MSRSLSSAGQRAVYGLRLSGVDGGGMLSAANGEPWPSVHVERVGGDAAGDWHLGFGGRRACFRLREGLLRLEREYARMTIRTDAPLAEDQLVHPWLAAGAAMFARWNHRDAFHGGGVVVGGRAWAVLATQDGGKSTLLAALARRGLDVVSDDLLVIESGHVYAGPRCVDLRPGSVEALGLDGLPSARGSTRYRLPLGPIPGRLPLAGIVQLAWADEVEVVRVPLAERIARLRIHNSHTIAPASETGLLDLAALTTLELRRPRNLDTLGPSVDVLHEALLRASST